MVEPRYTIVLKADNADFQEPAVCQVRANEGIDDTRLCEALRDAEAGKISADYGGGVIKQRIARPNEGKSGGYRSVILYRRAERAFFVYGFPKNERENIGTLEERTFKELAKMTLAFSNDELARLITAGVYKEIECNG